MARNGILNLAGTLVGGAASIALVVVVANGVAQDVAGMLFTATSFFLIVTAISGLGTDVGLAHTIQRQLAVGSLAGAVRTVWIALRPVLGLSVAAAVVMWFVAPWLATVLGTGEGGGANAEHGATMTAMLRVLAVSLPMATAYDTILAATQAHQTMRPNVIVEKLGRLPGQILCIVVVLLVGAGPVWLAVAWVAPYAVGLVGVALWYRSIVAGLRAHPAGDVRGQGTEDAAPPATLARDFWGFTAPRALGRVCQVALQRSDIVLVAALLSPRHAAVYTAATRFLVLGQLGVQAIQQVLQPQLAALFARADLAGVRESFSTSTAWLMALAWPIYLCSAVAAPVLLKVFGGGYEAGQATVVILALTMLATTATGSVDVVLLMAGRSRQSLFNNAAALVVDLVLVVVLVPRLGITGAAIAWAAALAVRNTLPMLQVRRAYGVMSFGPAVLWVAAAAALCFGVVPLLVRLVAPMNVGVVIGWLVPMCVLYAALLWKGRNHLQLGAFRSALAGVPLGRIGAPARRLHGRARQGAGQGVLTGVNALRRLPLPHGARVALSTLVLRRPGLARVPMDRLLLGIQDGIPASTYAEEFDDLLWASTPVTRGPHADLLRLAAEHGELTDEAVLASPYAEHARRCLRLTGRYFWATDEHGIVEVARSFLARAATDSSGEVPSPVAVGTAVGTAVATERTTGTVPATGTSAGGTTGPATGTSTGTPTRASDGGEPPRAAQSGASDPVLVAPIRDSDCFQVIDGHHRLALLAHRGAESASVKVKRVPVTTPLQDLLGQMSWIGGKKELYQPLDAPELQRSWTTVRRCTDRLAMMERRLAAEGIEGPGHSYLDVACCYGWFVRQLGDRGFAAEGIERDPLAPRLAAGVYGLAPERITVGDAVEFLRAARDAGRRWDVVSCFSLLHHFALGRASVSAEELAELLDSVTGRVLFLDTGQEHEAWFARSLRGWDTEYVGRFLTTHTGFDRVVDLGPDEDAVAPYADNYGRHLFAGIRGAGPADAPR
ncbi:polysaccharide biosynthesis C-terminal domain-containing protein [Actinopolymorpha sp. NPDC004070]|uniref:methyltransferase domain-containing protein n=1 Tax=Actinopolymorpha sp. NPDC004070 TaxID=3154548 RepID=UPI0033B44E60